MQDDPNILYRTSSLVTKLSNSKSRTEKYREEIEWSKTTIILSNVTIILSDNYNVIFY